MSILIYLLYVFFKIGLFSFGGGYAMLPLIRQYVVVQNTWVTAKEFTDLVAISQATPGPIAINAATYIGFKVGGIWGSIFATLGIVLPSFIIMLIITKFFLKFKDNKYMEDAFSGIRKAAIGLIAAAAILVAFDSFIDYKSIIIFLVAFIASYKYKADPILMTILAGVAGFFIYK
jgi:chromate transporter